MARNKYPEETVNRILDVAFELFSKNGYEQTTVQDIINHLGGLTKGAIYHHFKSKEEIMIAVTERMFRESAREIAKLRDAEGMTGLEKLKAMVYASLSDISQEQVFSTSIQLLDNPQMMANELKESLFITAPHYIQPIIEQGVADGSIQTDHPKEMAQVFILLANVWLNPLVVHESGEDFDNKIAYARVLFKQMGIDAFDDAIAEKLRHFTALHEKNEQ